jgi:hypothetical protein
MCYLVILFRMVMVLTLSQEVPVEIVGEGRVVTGTGYEEGGEVQVLAGDGCCDW